MAAGDFAATAEKLLIRHGKKIVGKQLEISYYLAEPWLHLLRILYIN